MRMGNLMWRADVVVSVMAAKSSTFGMYHVTVVPQNFRRDRRRDAAREDASSEE